MSKGRIIKLFLNDLPINASMDNFLFNIVKNRTRNQFYITQENIKLNSLKINDYIFIQDNDYITHYMKCQKNGPILDEVTKTKEISVKDITKIKYPIKSNNYMEKSPELNLKQINEILTNGH